MIAAWLLLQPPPVGFPASFADNPWGVQGDFPVPALAHELDKGTAYRQRVSYEVQQADLTFRIDVMEFAEANWSAPDEMKILDKAVNGAQTMTKFVVQRHQYLRVNNHPAREFEIQVEKGPLMRQRLILAKPLLVHAVVIGPTESVRGERGTKFLESVLIRPQISN